MPESTRTVRKTGKKAMKKTATPADPVVRKSAPKPGTKSGSKSGRGDASRRSAVFDVQLTLHVNDGITRDARTVRIQATVAPGGRADRVFALSQADREKNARRIIRTCRPQRIASLLSVLSHPQRIVILGKLLESEATHKMLGKQTALKAGPLYHHLRELRSAGLIGPKVRDLYVITRAGKRAILTAIAFERLCRGA
jgi:DNA-binding transcriptional ArsR family regulator